MKTTMLTLAVLLSATVMAFAAPLDPNKVSADAKWIIHVDADAMHDSDLVERAFDHWKEHENGQKHLDKAREELGLDLCEDVHSVTLYNTGFAEHEGVMVASAKFDPEKLEEKVEGARDHAVTDYNGVELHTWTDHKHEGRTAAGAFVNDQTLVLGSSPELVKEAISVLAGDRPSLSDAEDNGLSGQVPDQAGLVVRVIGLADAKLPHKSELPKGIDELGLTVGEDDEDVFIKGRVRTKNTETAQNVKTALEGLRAMALLKHGDSEARQYLEDAKIVQSGDVVELELAAPADTVWKAMKKAKKEKERRKSARHD